jgi:hypothetical protein
MRISNAIEFEMRLARKVSRRKTKKPEKKKWLEKRPESLFELMRPGKG